MELEGIDPSKILDCFFPPVVDSRLSMRGKIRTKEKCPSCGGKFTELPRGIVCTKCGTIPRRYYLDLNVIEGSRVRIYSDRDGQPFDSYRKALRALEVIRYEIDNHTFDPNRYVASDIKEYWFENLLQRWLQKKEQAAERGDLSPSYLKVLRTYASNYFIPFFRNKDVREIKARHLDDFLDSLPKNLSDKYRHNILTALENFFNHLVTYQIIERKPPFPSIPVTKSKKWKWADASIQREILKYLYTEYGAEEPNVPRLIEFLTETGLRPGEGRALKWKDYDAEQKILYVRRTFSERKLRETTKGRREDLIPLTERACEILQEIHDEKPMLPESFIFTTRSGRIITENRLRAVWSRVREHFGVEMRLYDFTRHSLPSQLVKQDVPLPVIQKILRHSDIRTTMKYTHVNLDTVRECLESRRKKLAPVATFKKSHKEDK